MNKDVGIIISWILFIVYGFFLGYSNAEDKFEKKAIEANCGYYDPTTREFKFGRQGNENTNTH